VEDLKEVIKRGKESGISNEDLRTELIKKGYPDDEIKSAFGELEPPQTKDSKQIAFDSSKYHTIPFWTKLKYIVTSPTKFFNNVREPSIGSSIWMVLAAYTPIIILGVLSAFLLISAFSSLSGGGSSILAAGGIGLLIVGFYLVFLFGIMLAFSFIVGGIFHAFLRIFKGNGGFTDTYNAMMYGFVPLILSWIVSIPLLFIIINIGPVGFFMYFAVYLVFGIYSIYFTITGFAKYHSISKGMALLAYFMPAIIIISLLIFLAFSISGPVRQFSPF